MRRRRRHDPRAFFVRKSSSLCWSDTTASRVARAQGAADRVIPPHPI